MVAPRRLTPSSLSFLRRVALAIVALALASPLTGCLMYTWSVYCVQGTNQYGVGIRSCDLHAQASASACVSCQTFTTDAAGCMGPWNPPCASIAPDHDASLGCGLLPASTTLTLCYWEDDPVLVEIPSTWLPGVCRWSTAAGTDSGSVNMVLASGLMLPKGGGPIAAESGKTAWIAWFDHAPAPGSTLDLDLTYSTTVSDSGCVRGMETAALMRNGVPIALLPDTAGASFNFSTSGTGVQTFCLEPSLVTPARQRTWGELKSIYR